jgi:putative membrane-bound dehydrogenase-like protein
MVIEEIEVRIPFHWVPTLLLFLSPSLASGQPPACSDHRLVIELVAKEPDIVTPTGIAVDEEGRIWIIENNTHERPVNYRGAPSDRIRVFSDFGSDGMARRITTFAEGFTNSMGLTLDTRGGVYLVTRSEIYRLRDTKGNGIADERTVIARLITEATYPHNGLCGFAWDGLGNLYFGLGENRGADYKLVGTDGTTLTGGGEGGSIYRCRPDGTGLVRVATGFWNPFGLTVDAFGRLFAVDNDPDSRGPCRLMHIIQGGDYGYRYRNGRKGIHPFTAWNGELPGTLPMVAGTGEAPCGIVAYESTGLPAQYRGDLIVASWGDHVVERFRLKSQGATFVSKAEPIVRGGEDFRPVGLAMAPDGTLYLSDWVDKSYPVHGKGRIWRIRAKTPATDDGLRPSQVSGLDSSQLRRLLSHPKQTIRMAAGNALMDTNDGKRRNETITDVIRSDPDSRARIQALWCAARLDNPVELLRGGMADALPEVRAEAVRLLGSALPNGSSQRDEGLLRDAALRDISAFVRMQAILQLKSEASLQRIVALLANKDPFIAGAALDTWGRPGNSPLLLPHACAEKAELRVGVLLALRRTNDSQGRASIPQFLADSDPGVRRAAIQWVGEEKLFEYAERAKAAAYQPPVTRELFEAYLATLDFLSGRKRKSDDEPSGDDFLALIVKQSSQPAVVRALALRMLRPDHRVLTAELLNNLLTNDDIQLASEAMRVLAGRADPSSQEMLRQLVKSRKSAAVPDSFVSLAVMGLAQAAAGSRETEHLLLDQVSVPGLESEALRSLRGLEIEPGRVIHVLPVAKTGDELKEIAAQIRLLFKNDQRPAAKMLRERFAAIAGPRPATEAAWRQALAEKGDAEAGERVFFHLRGPRCSACHRVDGRGTAIGPDLSGIGRSTSREKLIESILTPSKEIAPRFTSWQVATRDGRVRIGMIVEEGPDSTVTLADNQGKLEIIHRNQIEERHAVGTSIMPDNLQELMTVQEFRDLIAYLCARK